MWIHWCCCCCPLEELGNVDVRVGRWRSVCEGRKCIGGMVIAEQRDEVIGCLLEIVFGSDSRIRDGCWEPFERCTVAGGVGVGDEDLIAAVVFFGATDVESINAMNGEGATLCRGFMEDDASTWDGKGRPIEIKITEEAGMGRELGLAPGGTEEI